MPNQSNALTVEDAVYEIPYEIVNELNIDHLVTEDDTPVDNLFSERQQRLLIETLYSSWKVEGDERKFFAAANVGIFYLLKGPAIIPDVLLSLDVEAQQDLWAKEHRSYFIWEFGKPPDVVIEIVSNKVGGELSTKLEKYARTKVSYYIVFDPAHHLSEATLSIFRLDGYEYQKQEAPQLAGIHLGVMLWEGEYCGTTTQWLRWVDEQGNLILTGKERADKETSEKEKERNEKNVAVARAEKLAAMLRELGQDPDKV